MRLLKVLLTCALVLAPATAWADPVTIFSVQREARAWAPPVDDHASDGDAITATAVGTGAISSSTLLSSFADPHNFIGSGTAVTTVTSPTPASSALHDFRVGFILTSPHAYSAQATYAGQSTYPPGSDQDVPSSAATFSYELGADAPVWSPNIFDHFAINTAGVFGHTGILQPGRYIFVAHSAASTNMVDMGSAGATHAFSLRLTDLQVTPVPEPGSMLLLGTGLAGIIRTVRRRRAA